MSVINLLSLNKLGRKLSCFIKQANKPTLTASLLLGLLLPQLYLSMAPATAQENYTINSNTPVRFLTMEEVPDDFDINKQQAIKGADDSISALPSVEKLTLDDKPDVVAARALVNMAKTDYGAVDDDFNYLPKLMASENRIYELEGIKPTPIKGDVSGSGSINVQDVVLVMRHILELKQLTAEQLKIADVNGDGIINVLDVTLILQNALGLINKFPA